MSSENLGRQLNNLVGQADGSIMNIDGFIVKSKGTTVPADATVGHEVGALFMKTDGGVGTSLFVNEGSRTSSDYNAVVSGADFELVNDTTPQLGGQLDANNFTIGMEVQSLTGDGTDAINWGIGGMMAFTFGAFNETFTFTDPANPAVLYMSLLQDSVGTRLATWPANVTWAGGTAPTLTTTATTGKDLLKFVYDGTDYHGSVTSADLS